MIGELAALGSAISWAVAPILYRKALVNTSPISANIVRCATNAVVLFALLIGLGLFNVLASIPLWAIVVTIVSGIIGLGVGDTLYMVGLKALGVSRAVPLAATYPLFGLLWAVFLMGQPLSFLAAVGALVILLGIWLLSRQKNEDPISVKGKTLLVGVTFCLLTAVVWSVSLSLMDSIISNGVTSLNANYALITIRIASIGLFLTALAPLIDKKRGFLRLKRKEILLLCVGGLIANGLGWLLMNYSFLNISETQAIPISSASPLFAALAGVIFFHEKATKWSVSGAIAVVAGIVLIFAV